MNLTILKVIAVLVILAAAFTAGWQVKGAFVAKRDLAINEAKKEFTDMFRQSESNISTMLEDKLKELRANERVIEREKLKVIKSPVYNIECIDDAGLQLIERARTGKTNTEQPAN
jgi:hypothetical protein